MALALRPSLTYDALWINRLSRPMSYPITRAVQQTHVRTESDNVKYNGGPCPLDELGALHFVFYIWTSLTSVQPFGCCEVRTTTHGPPVVKIQGFLIRLDVHTRQSALSTGVRAFMCVFSTSMEP